MEPCLSMVACCAANKERGKRYNTTKSSVYKAIFHECNDAKAKLKRNQTRMAFV